MLVDWWNERRQEERNDGQVFQGLVVSLGGEKSKADILGMRKGFKIHDGTYES